MVVVVEGTEDPAPRPAVAAWWGVGLQEVASWQGGVEVVEQKAQGELGQLSESSW